MAARANAVLLPDPALVIHGDRDHRVPIGQGLRPWWDLVSRHRGDPADRAYCGEMRPTVGLWIGDPLGRLPQKVCL